MLWPIEMSSGALVLFKTCVLVSCFSATELIILSPTIETSLPKIKVAYFHHLAQNIMLLYKEFVEEAQTQRVLNVIRVSVARLCC